MWTAFSSRLSAQYLHLVGKCGLNQEEKTAPELLFRAGGSRTEDRGRELVTIGFTEKVNPM